MWLRRSIQFEARTGPVWNVRAHEKVGWGVQHRLQSRPGNHRNSDNTPDAIEESQFHIVMSVSRGLHRARLLGIFVPSGGAENPPGAPSGSVQESRSALRHDSHFELLNAKLDIFALEPLDDNQFSL